MQMVRICLKGLDIISVYRSKEEPFQSVVNHLQQRIAKDVDTLIVGDLNFCYSVENDLSRCVNLKKRKFFLFSIIQIA